MTATVLGAHVSGRAPRIDNVAAFARLYGVVRYFYPSDDAATLDWNRFAVHGVKQALVAADTNALETTLKRLFGPLGAIAIGTTLPPPLAPTHSDNELVAWRYLGPGFGGPSASSPYAGKRRHRSPVASIDGFITLMQTIPAGTLRGQAIRLRGQVRARAYDLSGSAALWLRVDRAGAARGFFDNMSDRPVRESEWREYRIEGTVADDATTVAFGVAAAGPIVADFDAIELAVRPADGSWTPVPIADAGFEAAADATAGGWMRAGSSKNAKITRPADDSPQGRQFQRFFPSPPVSNAELFDEAAPARGAHVDVDLGSGLKARVPLVLSEAEAGAHTKHSSDLAVGAAVATAGGPGDELDLDTRLADVVVAWNVFRHFYPYWTESRVAWDARLRPQLERAYAANTRDAQRDALRRLVADARDGHGDVIDNRRREERAGLPIRLRAFGSHLLVTASEVPADAPVGAVVTRIDGVPAAKRLAATMQLASGTTQWRQTRALQEITMCPKGAVVTLTVDSGTGPRQSRVRCDAMQPPAEKRPQPVAELTRGVWYVDLTRARMAEVRLAFETLANATGVVFDMRGYATDAGMQILPHLTDTPEDDRWMHVAKIVGPFGRSAGWQTHGWDLKPATPRLRGRIVFLTDGRAISYAESVMGYVADRKLGTIIGTPTAGTNGHVAMFAVPGGFNVTFTGMRVTGHDGRTPRHLVGIKPDISLTPTVAALREGRDELLDRAVALIRGK